MLRVLAIVLAIAAVAHCAPPQDVNAVVPEATAVAAARHPIFSKTVALFGWLDPENWFGDDSKKSETAGSCVDKIEESVKKDIASMLADIPTKAKTASEIAAKNAVQGQLVDQHLMHCKTYKIYDCKDPKAVVGCAKTCGTCRPQGSVLPANETKINDEVDHALAEVKHGLLEVVLKVVDSMVKTTDTNAKDTKEVDIAAKKESKKFAEHLVKDTKKVVNAARKDAKKANKAAIAADKKAARDAIKLAHKKMNDAKKIEDEDIHDAKHAVHEAIKNHKVAKETVQKTKAKAEAAQEAKIQKASEKALKSARAANKKFKKQDKELHAKTAKAAKAAAGSGSGSGGYGAGSGYGYGEPHVMDQALVLRLP